MAPRIAAVALVAAPVFMPGAAANDAPTALVVRIYGAGGITPDAGRAARVTAGATLAETGIALEWIDCEGASAGEPADRCAVRLANDELAVRLVRTPAQPGEAGQLPLGYSLVDARVSAGSLATIFLDRVEWLAHAADADPGTLLGLAIAHEIGHLLLGSTEHAATGVMRAIWSSAALRRHGQDWRFTHQHGARMRAAIHARGLPAR
jgi:hypothetical protein